MNSLKLTSANMLAVLAFSVAGESPFRITAQLVSRPTGTATPTQKNVVVGDGLHERFPHAVLTDYAGARLVLRDVLSLMQHLPDWMRPAINLDGSGGLEIEWRNGKRGLMIAIDEGSVTYVKHWGSNPSTEMRDGDLGERPSPQKLEELWSWLRAADGSD